MYLGVDRIVDLSAVDDAVGMIKKLLRKEEKVGREMRGLFISII